MATISESLTTTEQNERKLMRLAEKMLRVDRGALYGVDFLAAAALNRAVTLSSGFRTMIEARNFMCAAPLIRLQLDTALRVFAGTLVDDPHKLALDILEGKHVRRLKDRDGNLMTDAYLLTRVENHYPGAKSLYEKTSGYIHFSDTHFYDTIGSSDRGRHSILIGKREDFPDDVYLGALQAFARSTEILASFIAAWVHAKESASSPNDA